MRVLSRVHSLVIFSCLLFICAATEGTVNAQPPAVLVQLDVERSVFYRDEFIPYSIMHYGTKSDSSGCSFGFSGQTVQLLRNGSLIYQEPLGAVSMILTRRVNQTNYATVGGSLLLPYAVRSQDIDVKDNYQLRATCGDQVSPLTKVFHVEPWAKPVDGLQVLIRPVKTEFRLGELIRVEVTMRNRGSQPRLCPVPLDDDGRGRNFWELQPHWLDSRPYPNEDVMYGRSLKVLKPGESRRAVFTLNTFRGTGVNQGRGFGDREGTYEVWFSVFFEQEDEDIPAKYRTTNLWRADLSSNIIDLKVKK